MIGDQVDEMGEIRNQMKTHISLLILPTQTELEDGKMKESSLPQLSKPSQRQKQSHSQ